MPPVTVLPFHQDELLSEASIPLPDTVAATRLTPALAPGGRWDRLAALYGALADEVAANLAVSPSTAVVSGDCLVMLGSLAGAQRAGLDPSVVWFDAHGDVHTLETSTSGYIGGMALRMAMGGDHAQLAGRLGLRSLAEDRAVLVDARDLDPAEVRYLRSSGVRRRAVEEIDVDDLPEGQTILHIDVDVIDSREVPGLRFPVPGGASARSVLAAARRILSSGRVAVLDIACPWSDPTSDKQQSIRMALLGALLDSRP